MRVLTQGQRPRKQYTLSGFKGVDYSSSPLDVAKYRAAKMQNFLLEDGTLHKRKGWEQAAQFDGQINGLWPFDDGDKQCVIVHAGTDIYAWDSASGTKTKLTGDISTIADRRSYAVYKNKKLYILCGDYLAYGHFSDSDDGAYELRTVAGDTDTYVPTTSIRGAVDDTTAYSGSVDNVNMLSIYRRNVFNLSTANDYYAVDSGYIAPDLPVKATVTDISGETTEIEIPDKNMTSSAIKHIDREYGMIKFKGNSDYVSLTVDYPYGVTSGDANNYTSTGKSTHVQVETSEMEIWETSEPYKYRFPVTKSVCLQEGYLRKYFGTNNYDGTLYSTCAHITVTDISSNSATYLQQKKYIAIYAEDIAVPVEDGWSVGTYGNIFTEEQFNSPDFNPFVPNADSSVAGILDVGWTNKKFCFKSNPFAQGVAEAEITYVKEEPVYYTESDYVSQIANCRTGCLFGVDGRNDRLFIGGNPDFPNVCYNTAKNDFTYFPDQQTSTCGEETSEISGFCRLGDGTLAVLKNTRDNNDVSVYYITGSSVSMAEGEEGNTLTYDEFFVKAGSIGESCITAHGTANLSGDPLMVSENGVYGIVLSGNVATDERYARERSRSVNTELLKHDLSDACGIAYKNRYYLAVDGECFVADARYKYTLDADMDDTYNYEWFHYKNIPARVWNVLDGELWFGSDTGGVYRMDSGGWADISRTWAEPGTDGTLTVANGVFTYSEDLAAAVESATYVLADGVKANITAGETAQTFTLTAAETDADILTAAALVFVTETPVSAAWYSGILDLGTPLYRKNLWLLSIGLRPMSGAEVQFGYRIRRGKNLSDAVADIVGGEANAYGAETFDFGDVDFKRFSFEANGFMSQYTKRVFERDFVYMQLYFRSDSASDCVITDITAVFTEVRKNLGVG